MEFSLLNHEITLKDVEKFDYPNSKYGVIVHIENDKGELLLQQRGSNSRDEKRKIEYIGGSLESNESFKEAILREIKEEAGEDMRLEFEDFSGIFHYYKNNINWIFAIFKAKYIDGEIRIMEPSKCLGYHFFTKEEALNSPIVTEGCKFLIKNIY